MVVVLPAPFGPRKAKISPSLHFERNTIDGGKVAELLQQILDSDHRGETSSSIKSILNGSV